MCWKVKSLSRVWLFATPWPVAYHSPPSMGFPGKSTGMGCHCLLQRIFPAQGSNQGLPHCRQTLYHLSDQGSPCVEIIIKILHFNNKVKYTTRLKILVLNNDFIPGSLAIQCICTFFMYKANYFILTYSLEFPWLHGIYCFLF